MMVKIEKRGIIKAEKTFSPSFMKLNKESSNREITTKGMLEDAGFEVVGPKEEMILNLKDLLWITKHIHTLNHLCGKMVNIM